ncbi:hypothetical protein LT493_02665 [Streptomyces tricolor]|nr:hypothetical protein [Streptomyces tricolor]
MGRGSGWAWTSPGRARRRAGPARRALGQPPLRHREGDVGPGLGRDRLRRVPLLPGGREAVDVAALEAALAESRPAGRCSWSRTRAP